MQLQMAVESPVGNYFAGSSMSPGGTAALVGLRRQFLPTLKDHPERAGVDADFVHLFRSWFNRGFLVLRRIDWRTPALVLERLIQYEAVHQIQGWGELRRRLESDRRCYAFFHPALPDEPLIFIEVALTEGFLQTSSPCSTSMRRSATRTNADCAVFYSITDCQSGLRGVSFGNFLIKQAVEDLRRDFRRLRTFATLSPVRLRGVAHGVNHVPPAVAAAERIAVSARKGTACRHQHPGTTAARDLTSCAHYLLNAKRVAEPLDSVARFHLTNGARLERLRLDGRFVRDGQSVSRSVSRRTMSTGSPRSSGTTRHMPRSARWWRLTTSKRSPENSRQRAVGHESLVLFDPDCPRHSSYRE